MNKFKHTKEMFNLMRCKHVTHYEQDLSKRSNTCDFNRSGFLESSKTVYVGDIIKFDTEPRVNFVSYFKNEITIGGIKYMFPRNVCPFPVTGDDHRYIVQSAREHLFKKNEVSLINYKCLQSKLLLETNKYHREIGIDETLHGRFCVFKPYQSKNVTNWGDAIEKGIIREGSNLELSVEKDDEGVTFINIKGSYPTMDGFGTKDPTTLCKNEGKFKFLKDDNSLIESLDKIAKGYNVSRRHILMTVHKIDKRTEHNYTYNEDFHTYEITMSRKRFETDVKAVKLGNCTAREIKEAEAKKIERAKIKNEKERKAKVIKNEKERKAKNNVSTRLYEDIVSGRTTVIDNNIWMDKQYDSFFEDLCLFYSDRGWRYTMFKPQYDELYNKRIKRDKNNVTTIAYDRIELMQSLNVLQIPGLNSGKVKGRSYFDSYIINRLKYNGKYNAKSGKDNKIVNYVIMTDDRDLRVRLNEEIASNKNNKNCEVVMVDSIKF